MEQLNNWTLETYLHTRTSYKNVVVFLQREAKWIGQPVTEINSRNCKPNDFASYAGFWKAYQVEGANKEFWSFSATLFVDVKPNSTCLKLKLLQDYNVSFAECFCLDFI